MVDSQGKGYRREGGDPRVIFSFCQESSAYSDVCIALGLDYTRPYEALRSMAASFTFAQP
jgi:hypothetical protein